MAPDASQVAAFIYLEPFVTVIVAAMILVGVCVKILGDSLRANEFAATHGKFDLRRIGIQKRDAHPSQ